MHFIEAFFLREWQQPSAWQLVLRPFAWLFSAVVRVRRWSFARGWHSSMQLPRPVLVVGNISVGGTGKTPLVVALAKRLKSKAQSVAIVTRGSGGHEQRLVRRIDPAETDQTQGDEARLLAKRTQAPVYASVDRVAAGLRALSEHPETALLLSDDGLQHYRLSRVLEVAVVDGIRGLGNGQLLPAGPLREPASRLATVDCIVVNTTASSAPNAQGELPRGDWLNQVGASQAHLPPIFAMQYGNESFVRLSSGAEVALDALAAQSFQQRVVAVAGIGYPARFFSHLRALGVQLHATHAFADHHAFVATDFRGLAADLILMTEKDAVKCRAFADARFVEMRVDAILPEAFYQFIESRLAALDANGH